MREVGITIRQDDSGEATVEVRLPPQPPPAPGLPSPDWLVVSPLTARVVRLLCAAGWMTREEVAQRLSESPDGKLASLLTDLTERHLLESSSRKGFHLCIPDSADPEAFRGRVLDWLGRIDQPPSAD